MLRSFTYLGTLLAFFVGAAHGQELSDSQINLVGARLAQGATKSWELGARTQAILEANASRYSVFANNALPPPHDVPGDQQGGIQAVWGIARNVMSSRGGGNDPRPLAPDDASAADSASLGIAVLLANWTNLDSNPQFGSAASSQVDYILSSGSVPKTSDGAISHRRSDLQLWSDSTFMLPPFLAYYGVLTHNKTVVQEAYNQIKLARWYLRDTSTNVWRHVVIPGAQGGSAPDVDGGFWATGNGWAAAGMLRVYATIDRSEFKDQMKNQLKDLKHWVGEIHQGVYGKFFDGNNLLRNYLNDTNTFYDSAATAFLAATVYRASTVMDTHNYIPYAERTRMTLLTPNGGPNADTNRTIFNNYEFFTTDGWLRPVANPSSIGQQMTDGKSPEAQAFVVYMYQGWKEWRAAGEKGINAASRRREVAWAGAFAGLVVGVFFAFGF